MTTMHGSLEPEPQEAPHPLGVGHRLDEFELLEVIGEGGFGIVYRAYDHSLQREVAIKEYMPSMLARRVGDNSVHVRSERLTATFQAGLRSFINEARTLAQFSHPALVRVHRFWEANSTAYMVIQLYKGRTLRQLAEAEPAKITEPWLTGMLGPLLGALETLHRAQCFHRDIAPDNIFIQHDDLPVLLDFGAARKSIADLVDEVAVMVKSGYSPIEQYADDNTLLQGPYTDLYALGAVLYRAVTGHAPPSAVVRSVQDAYVPLSSLGRADLSPAFCAAVDHTLAVHSKDRTQTVAAFAAELGLVKLGDIYVSGMGVPATLIASAPMAATPTPPPMTPQPFSPLSAPAPLEDMLAATIISPQVAMPQHEAAAPAPRAAAARKPSRPPWGMVIMLVMALIAVGCWIGLRLTQHPLETSTAMAPSAPPPSAPLSNPSASATAVAPPAAPAAGPDNTAPSPAAGGSSTVTAGTPPSPAAGGSSTATAGTPPATPSSPTLAPLDTVPVNPPATLPEAALATSEVEDWNLAQAENTREGYEAYLRRYRRGLHAREARNAIAEIVRLTPTVPTPPGTLPAGSTTVTAANGATSTTVAGSTPTATVPAGPPGMGRVVLNIRPWGQVFVDGADRGVSPPLKSLSLRPGIYNIEVRNGDLDVFKTRVTVQDSKSAPVVNYEFK